MTALTQLPVGTKLKVKESGEIVILEEIRNFPTRFKTTNELGQIEFYKTHEVEVIEFSKVSFPPSSMFGSIGTADRFMEMLNNFSF